MRLLITLIIVSLSLTDARAEKIGFDALMVCNHCHEEFYGNCAKAVDLQTVVCSSREIFCIAQSYYDPWNKGYGGKYNFHRGCTPCGTESCAQNFTMKANSILSEFFMETEICGQFRCNRNELDDMKVENIIGLKT